MRKILTRLQSIATFDLPLRNSCIQQAFIATHENYSKEYQGWSLNATRKKIIADYWTRHVLVHFVTLYLTAVVISLPFNTNFNQSYFPGLFIGGLIGMPILVFWLYGQLFYFDFLPKLDTIIENYEGKQLKHLKKCQQAQMTNFAAAVVYYAFAKTSRFKIPPINHQYGEIDEPVW